MLYKSVGVGKRSITFQIFPDTIQNCVFRRNFPKFSEFFMNATLRLVGKSDAPPIEVGRTITSVWLITSATKDAPRPDGVMYLLFML
jgi:hypothetical protein